MDSSVAIEYLIQPDGTIIERVINGEADSCLTATSAIEAELGVVEQRQLLPEYYETTSINMVENSHLEA